MLILLTKDQIATHQHIITVAIEKSLPPIIRQGDPNRTTNILAAMFTGEMLCWIWVDPTRQEKQVTTWVFTTPTFDKCTGVRNLLIYGMYSTDTGKAVMRKYADGMKTLTVYAREKGYHQVIMYSSNEHIIEICKTLGGDTSYTFIAMEV